ncbi:MAG: DUF998 domain-containing protein [Maribacter sp.]|nr:DUF998 domain-containing protein [Maribacter sp.]
MKKLLSLGWITTTIFIVGTFVLGGLLVNYSPISQTISEIGEVGSPLYLQWQIFTMVIGILLMLFAIGIISFSRHNNLSVIPGIFIIFSGLSEFGIALFASPHPLHNVFGLSMTVGYFSALIFVLFWKNKLGITFKRVSLIAFILIILGIFLNLTPAFAPSLYPLEYYGIVQRFLLFTFYLYFAFVSFSTVYTFSNIKKPLCTTKNKY